MMKPLTFIETPFKEKFGTPRQSLLIPEAMGVMRFPKTDFFSEAFRGIEESSHLWLIFEFHLIKEAPFQGLIRPPRFKQQKKMGVFATRSPHRPNRLGLSVVKFERLDVIGKEISLSVSGVDLVSGTPIFDIKPYVPYADLVSAKTPFQEKPFLHPVIWRCEKVSLAPLIEKVIALDPRPGQNQDQDHDHDSKEEYGVGVGGYNVRFRYLHGQFEILKVDWER